MKYCAHDYQAYATDFVLSHPYCGLILDMGLGKSVITLTALWALLLDSFDVGCVLVVAPKRVAEDTWPREISKWEHLKGLTYSLVMGSEKERRAALSRKAMIYIINRENVSWLVEHTHWRFDALVIDELSSFKSAKALRFKALKKVRPLCGRVIGLTGTPAPNTLIDLWPQMYLLDMGQRLGRFLTHYRERFFVPDKRNREIVYSYKLRQGAEFTALFAIADSMAIGAMRALRDEGRAVPQDCSVIAIDGLELSAYIEPPLTTLCQPMEEMGQRSAQILLGLIHGHGAHCCEVLPTRLRQGGSVQDI